MSEAPVAVVTGGGRGIGRAAAVALGATGHRVCVNDPGADLDGSGTDPAPAEAVAEEIRAAGGDAMVSPVDARTRSGAEDVVKAAEVWAGRPPTVLVHAAGVLRDRMLHKASDDDWSEVLGVHLHVAIELTRAVAAPIRAGRWGRVVYVGGAAGLVGSVGQASYDVAKAGLFGLTRAVALEMAGRDVCVNYVAPFAFTRMTESIPPATDQLRRYKDWAVAARADDVGRLIGWLCSQDAAGISGQVFGARGAEVSIWSQPRPAQRLFETAGWDARALSARARPAFEPYLTPLESEFDLFGDAPVAVVRDATSA
ncbi:MAG: SDR family NAD(P)-dependent oxidoreductase [Actinomycetota bacterium]|nr:SDR family NAD(P)-dependent oxidoreductase [Actinomycetota bacterium]